MVVQATARGFYGQVIRNIGDVFTIADADFSDSSINLAAAVVPPTWPLWGWMIKIS